MRKVIAGICPKHGYYDGEYCNECDLSSNEAFYTSKDKLWEFIDDSITGKPIEIRSKRQYERLLKENNKYQVLSMKDVEIEKKRYDRNLKENSRRAIHENVVSVYKDVKQMGGDKRRIEWRMK